MQPTPEADHVSRAREKKGLKRTTAVWRGKASDEGNGKSLIMIRALLREDLELSKKKKSRDGVSEIRYHENI